MGRRVINRPWQIVSGDIAGPMTRNKQGNKYILVFEDLFTRYVKAFAIRKADGETIWKHLKKDIFLRWGLPEVFLSDNGTEFKNRLIDSQLEEYGVKHEVTPPYHP